MSLHYNKASLTLLVMGLLLGLSFMVLHQSRANAASSSYSITMTPSSTQLSALPGGSANSSFSVINEGVTGYTMTISVAPYHVFGDNYSPEFNVLPGTTDASKWISLSAPATQNLAAGKVQSIHYSLNVPAHTAPGGYYAVIFAEAVPPSSSGVTALNRVGDILYITVEGPVVQRGSISPVKLPYISLGNNLPLGLLIRDSGGLQFITNVNITATSLFGGAVYSAQLQRYVLPQTQRLVSVSWTHLPLFGIYKISRTATVVGKTQSLKPQWVLIIRPWLLVVLLLILIGILSLVIGRIVRQPKKSNLNESKKTDVRS